MTNETGMTSTDGNNVSLKSVKIDAHLSGLLLNVTTQHRYVNDNQKNIEVVYTFPLPAHAVILGVDMTIAGKKLAAVVMEKSDAEEDYEEAIQSGDLPVMVERSGPGLYTANIGNLKRGEEVAIEVHWAQLLALRDQSIRVAIPTVIGERYGDAHDDFGLAYHQSGDMDPLAQYPLAFNLTVHGDVAQSIASCASHMAQITGTDGLSGKTQTVSIQTDAYLDRDVVVLLNHVQTQQFAIAEPTSNGGLTALISTTPTLASESAAPLALKILVDCSGSMDGDSIEQARQAVHQVIQRLQPGDFVSYSRFGTEVAHNFSSSFSAKGIEDPTCEEMLPATDKKIANISRLIRNTSANMGGTEMQAALVSTIRDIRLPHGLAQNAVVPSLLLITDGDIWDHQGVIRAARQSGHRIFNIGVGSSPAESLLRELTEITGGVCEFVTPNEPMTDAALRLMARMRSAHTAQIRLNWGAQPAWQSTLPSTVFDNETIHVFATLSQPPAISPMMEVISTDGAVWSASAPISICPAPDDNSTVNPHDILARMAAHQRAMSEDEADALKTALEFGLVTSQTNLLLVHVREESDKAKDLPTLQQIKQMHAAGHSGLGSAYQATLRSSQPTMAYNLACYASPTVWRDPRTSFLQVHEEMTSDGVDKLDIPAFLQRQVDVLDPKTLSPAELINIFNQLSLRYTDILDAVDELLGQVEGESTWRVIDKAVEIAGDRDQGIAALLLWVSEHKQLANCKLVRHALRISAGARREIGDARLQAIFAELDQLLGASQSDAWDIQYLAAV